MKTITLTEKEAKRLYKLMDAILDHDTYLDYHFLNDVDHSNTELWELNELWRKIYNATHP